MARKRTGFTTLILEVTIRDEDAQLAKDALMATVGSDRFPEALYSTSERPALRADQVKFERVEL